MIAFISLFIPSIISVAIFQKIEKKNYKITDFIFKYSISLLFITFINISVICFLFENKYYYLNTDSFSNYFTFKYLLISILVGGIFPFIFNYIQKYLRIKMEIDIDSRKMTFFDIFKNILSIIFILSSFVIFYTAEWIYNYFGDLGFDQFLFHLNVPLTGTNTSIFLLCISSIWKSIFISFFITSLFFYVLFNRKVIVKINFKNKVKNLSVFPISFFAKWKLSLSLILLIICSIIGLKNLNFFTYIKYKFSNTKIYENYYVNPNDVELTFPKEKKNLLLIYLESMEASFTSIDSGGAFGENLIPDLTKFSEEYITFSNTDKLVGGALPAYGTTWTVAGMVASSAGIPLTLPIGDNNYGLYKNFLPEVVTLGDILNEAGYNQLIMAGSDFTFAGRDKYYTQHKNFEIFDYYTAKSRNLIADDYYEWWGFEDRKLFDYAKTEILKLAQKNEPFNLNILTVDTHFYDGYLDPLCSDNVFDQQYKNVLYCSNNIVNNFITWVQSQDFYKDTSIVIIGDHLTMDKYFMLQIDENYQRTIYNTFINSSVKAANTKNRSFTSFDFYPTILASMGISIEGNKLGLGTNLFSGEQTLTEKIGIDVLNNELQKNSKYYNQKFLYGKR